MDTIPGLTKLQPRKRELLLESELNRQVLRVELEGVRLQVERFKRGYGWAQGAWKWAAPLAGILLASKVKRHSTAATKGSFVVNVLGAAWNIWSSLRKRKREATPEH